MARRAWTFQEGFPNKRRLVFTRRQAVLICNTHTRYEAHHVAPAGNPKLSLEGWLPPQGRDHSISPMKSAMDYLSLYTYRRFSYDSDALNAIVGALNTLKDILGSKLYFDQGSAIGIILPFADDIQIAVLPGWPASDSDLDDIKPQSPLARNNKIGSSCSNTATARSTSESAYFNRQHLGHRRWKIAHTTGDGTMPCFIRVV